MNASILAPLEYRALAQAPALEQSGPRTLLTGYAIRFDEPSELLTAAGGATFVEVIKASALKRLGEQRDVKCLLSHDASKVLGSSRAGTLRLHPDAVGLRFELAPPNSPLGHDVTESVKRGDLTDVSFGFTVAEDGEVWQRDKKPPVREIRAMQLFEISLCAWGAFASNRVVVEQRARQQAQQIVAERRQQERLAREQAIHARLTALR